MYLGPNMNEPSLLEVFRHAFAALRATLAQHLTYICQVHLSVETKRGRIKVQFLEICPPRQELQ